jgi:hypothetical protein
MIKIKNIVIKKMQLSENTKEVRERIKFLDEELVAGNYKDKEESFCDSIKVFLDRENKFITERLKLNKELSDAQKELCAWNNFLLRSD